MEKLHHPPSEERCRPHWSAEYLSGVLCPEDEALFELHLERCLDCRNILERHAAEEGFWAETKSALNHPSDFTLPRERVKRLANSLRHVFLESIPEIASACDEDSDAGWKHWLGPPTMDGAIGRVLKYEVLSTIGQGGMGIVFRAIDTELNRIVALKTLTAQSRFHGEARIRLLREARATAILSHPNIIPIYALESCGGVPFIVSPYISGGNLYDYVVNHQLPIAELISMVIQIAEALAVLHENGIVHRDLKPSNILINQETKQLVLCDFGLARIESDQRITHEHAIAGTPFFMSPEQAEGREIDARSDLFSLGSLTYWLLSKEYPFSDRTKLGVLRKIVDESPAPMRHQTSEIPHSVHKIVQGLLIKNREERWGPASKISELFRQCQREAQYDLPNRFETTTPDIATIPAILGSSPGNQTLAPKGRGSSLILASLLAAAVVSVLATLLASVIVLNWEKVTSRISGNVGGMQSPDQSPAVQPNQQSHSSASHLSEIVAEKGVTTDSNTPTISTVEALTPFEDIGLPLTLVERTSIPNDLKRGVRQKKWLARLSKMSSQLIPSEILSLIIPLCGSEDPELASLAEIILSKSPFEEVPATESEIGGVHNRKTRTQNEFPLSMDRQITIDPFYEPPNPFQEVPNETNPKK